MKNVFLFLLLMLSLKSFGKDSPLAVLNKCAEKLNKAEGISYNAVYKFKYFNHSDTNVFSGRVDLLKHKSDTLFNGYVWFSLNDSITKFYDLDSVYVLNSKSKKATVYNVHGGDEWILAGASSGMRLYGFLKSEMFKRDTEKVNHLSFLKDTLIHGKLCYAIRITFPDGEIGGGEESRLYIEKSTYLPLFRKDIVFFQGNFQYREWYARDIKINIVQPAQFYATQIPSGYKRKTYVEPKESKEPPKLLDSNTIAPVVTGKNYFNHLALDSIDYAGKITLLDFWYMGCFPCISAIKEIEKLKEKYAGTKLQIFGINTFDNNEEAIKRLPQFLQYNKIVYPIMLVDKNIPDGYKVTAWPTFYIIGRDGKVAYHCVGYSDDLGERLDTVIAKLMNEK